MRQAKLSILSAATLSLGFFLALNAEDQPRSDQAKLMEQKLAFSQKILSSVVKEDFAEMSQNAEGLLKLAKTQWIKKESPEYRSQLKDFWIVVEGLNTSAQEKNGDGATLAYVQMTLSCVKCHKYLRKSEQ